MNLWRSQYIKNILIYSYTRAYYGPMFPRFLGSHRTYDSSPTHPQLCFYMGCLHHSSQYFRQNYFKIAITKNKVISCACYTILWIVIYTAVFSRMPDALQKDIGNYYIVPCLFFALQLVFVVGISHLHKCWRILCVLVYTTGVFLLFICAIFYASYSLLHGQSFDEYALLSVIATNPD